jgi:hypothetical protein
LEEEEELKKEQWANIRLKYEWLILEYEIKEASFTSNNQNKQL